MKGSKTFAALHVQEWLSFTARSGIISFLMAGGSWMLHLAGQEAEHEAYLLPRGGIWEGRTLFPNWNFPRMQKRTVLLLKVPEDLSQVVLVLFFI